MRAEDGGQRRTAAGSGWDCRDRWGVADGMDRLGGLSGTPRHRIPTGRIRARSGGGRPFGLWRRLF